MTTNFPTSLDAFTNPASSDNLNTAGVVHNVQHTDKNDAIEAVEAKVGIDASAVTTSHDYLIKRQLVTVGPFMRLDLPVSLSDATVYLAGDSSSAINSFVPPYAGVVRALTVRLSAARTAGTATFKSFKNGVAFSPTAVTAVIDGTNTQQIYSTYTNAQDVSFAAGDRLAVQVSTSSDWAPADTTDCAVFLIVTLTI